MKITIFTLGTRGDIQPFATLGEALKENGHDVTLCTAKNFELFAQSYSLKFHPINVDYEEFINSEEGRKITQVNLWAIRRNLSKLIFPLIENSLNEFYALAKESDLIIYRPKTFIDIFVDQLNIKAIRAAVIPAVEETTAFFNPIYSGLQLPGFLNKWSYKFNNLKYRFFRKPLKRFCLRNGLCYISKPSKSEVPFIYGISPHFLDSPHDWPKHNFLTGFWFSNKTTELSPDLLNFINAGEPPLLITFGSVPIRNKLKDLINTTITQINCRVILVKGETDWKTQKLAGFDNCIVVNCAPFPQLLPKVKAVIHHGGIGTTAECLRAGKPMLICPVLYPLGDHFFWGKLAHQKGCALKPIPLAELSVTRLTEKIQELISRKELYRESEKMAQRLRSENGVKQAVTIIEHIALSGAETSATHRQPLNF